MCGIIASNGPIRLAAGTRALAHRGPDAVGYAISDGGVNLGHTRLAVQDTSDAAQQPMRFRGITLVYNGELYNAPAVRQLIEQADPTVTWTSTGDTEVIAAALAVLGTEQALPHFDGMFALAWADDQIPGVLFLARDRGGEIPLHVHRALPFVAASEVKAFAAIGRHGSAAAAVDVPAGEWWAIDGMQINRFRFHTLGCGPTASSSELDLGSSPELLGLALARAVDRRAVSDVPVCSLLSGGIDSAAIALELTRHVPDLVCYTAKLDPRSKDLRCARETAEYLGVQLVEVDIPVPTVDDLSRVIGHIEMDFKAQVEIAWPCLLLAERMRADGFKVTYSGEGSDELWASYGFAYHGLQRQDWFSYRRDLIADQARKNFPRVNKAFMAHGIEARLPFLDPDVVDFALALPERAVREGTRQKAIIQRAYQGRLPESVTTRAKVAFQDGLGLKKAITAGLNNPKRYYAAELTRLFR